jgi:RNA polymerase sigma-B factor
MRLHRDGDPRAREILIERYLPLARLLARRYRGSGEPLDDLVQVASLGLVKAVDRWDAERGLAFTTFATPTILGELRRYLRDLTWIVRPPRPVVELALATERARQPLRAAIGREPTAGDLAAHLGRSAGDVRQALLAAGCRRAASLDCPVDDEDAGDVARVESADRDYEAVEARCGFDSLLSGLEPVAREVLTLRFEEDLLQREIAARIGNSQMHVSRLIRRSLRTLGAQAA